MADTATKHFTRGGQITFHNLRMLFQINKALWKYYLLVLVIATVFFTFLITPQEYFVEVFKYFYAWLINLSGFTKETISIPYHGKSYSLTAEQILSTPYFLGRYKILKSNLILVFKVCFILSIIVSLVVILYLLKVGKSQAKAKWVRGTKLVNEKALSSIIRDMNIDSNITIDSIPIIKDSEMQHFLIHGTVGTGKSQLMMKFIDSIRQRGDRVILYDKGCSFTPLFFNEEKDVILNSFDERCANWDMWEEAPRDSDFENMAESLIPLHGDHDPFFVMGARTVFSCCAAKMRHDKDRSLDKLIDLLVTGDFENLQDYLQGTAAATLVEGTIIKTALSVRTILTTYLKSLQTLRGLKHKKGFSIRNYILDESNNGWLFISSNGDQHTTLKPLISMWLAMASITMLSLTESRTRRIWFICDELPSLHKLPLLAETIAEVRKFGGCFMLGMQSHAQLAKVYGRSGASEIFDLLNTRYFFRSPSSEMAKLVEREIGHEEIEEARENYSYGANSIRDGISLGRNRVTRPIVFYPEVMELPDLKCFVRFPGQLPVSKLNLNYKARPKIAEHFLPRDLAFVTEPKKKSKVEYENPVGDQVLKAKEKEVEISDFSELL